MQTLVAGRGKPQLDAEPRIEIVQRLHCADKILARWVSPCPAKRLSYDHGIEPSFQSHTGVGLKLTMSTIIGNQGIANILDRRNHLAVDQVCRLVHTKVLRYLTQLLQHDGLVYKADIGNRDIPAAEAGIPNKSGTGAIDSHRDNRFGARRAQ